MNRVAPIHQELTAIEGLIDPQPPYIDKVGVVEQNPFCKICLQEQPNEEQALEMTEQQRQDCQMVVPCECSGSMGYVHQKCIRLWVERQTSTPQNRRSQCEICKSPIYFKCEKRKYWSCKKENLAQITCCNVLSAIVELFFISITIVVYRYSSSVSESVFLTYVFLVLIIVLSIIFILTIVIMLSEAFLRTQRVISRIYSIQQCERRGLRQSKVKSNRNIPFSQRSIQPKKRNNRGMVVQYSAQPLNYDNPHL